VKIVVASPGHGALRRLPNCRSSSGYALLMVLVVSGASLAIMAGVMNWSASYDNFTQRNSQYYKTLAVAEAATEKIVGRISRDFQQGGELDVRNNLEAYRLVVPDSAENPLWAGYEFKDTSGVNNRAYVSRLSDWQYNYLESKYPGLRAMASTYRVISNVRELHSPFHIVAAVQQDVQIASVPLFQFGVFYSHDLEVAPSSPMNVSGRIHSNRSIYTQGLPTFLGTVTASRQVLQQKHPNDPLVRTLNLIKFKSEHEGGLSSLNIPIGVSNNPTNLHALLEAPPGGEAANSALGKQRFYNKADLVIQVYDGSVVATSGRYNNFAINVPWLLSRNVIKTNNSFFNKRANLTVRTSEIDIAELRDEYSALISLLGREPKIIYIRDLRTQTSSTQPGIRLINGETLPSVGLTVATPNPIYIRGHYNSPIATRGTTNTIGTVPAAVLADAVTILSPSWTDGNSGMALSSRIASSTTINAAIVSGIVPSGNGYYSGGAENFFRLLEDWSGRTLSFNGSMVSLYYCQMATSPWGAGSDVYNTPVRSFTFDGNFLDVMKLPPGTPELRLLLRKQWLISRANYTGGTPNFPTPPAAPSGYSPF